MIRLQASADIQPKQKNKRKIGGLLALTVVLWVAITFLLSLLFGKAVSEPFTVALAPERMTLFGLSVSGTVVTTWVIMGILILAALLLRVFYIPRFKTQPKGLQNVLEIAIESIERYTDSKTEHLGGNLAAYLFTLALFLVASAVAELFGVRAPTADITMTFALALITFFLINYYGIRRKGLRGRIKALSNPTPVVLPLRIISDIALPVSMACRLFGNMLGGMIVMELLYRALGKGAFGVPGIVGLYFNVFHPLIQAFIFITLSLTFINEATE